MKPFWQVIGDKMLNFLFPLPPEDQNLLRLTAEEFLKQAEVSGELLVKNAKAVFCYKDPLVKRAIWLLKYKNNEKIADIFGELLANTASEWLSDLAAFDNFRLPLLVPVPMSKERQKERGGNHTDKLGLKMIEIMPEGSAEFKPEALTKIKETESQAKTKSRAARLQNLKDSFAADAAKVKGRNILLIDDVITTGATIEECRNTLLKAGAKRVIALSIAH